MNFTTSFTETEFTIHSEELDAVFTLDEAKQLLDGLAKFLNQESETGMTNDEKNEIMSKFLKAHTAVCNNHAFSDKVLDYLDKYKYSTVISDQGNPKYTENAAIRKLQLSWFLEGYFAERKDKMGLTRIRMLKMASYLKDWHNRYLARGQSASSEDYILHYSFLENHLIDLNGCEYIYDDLRKKLNELGISLKAEPDPADDESEGDRYE